jgi:arsenate reductase (glutaredoxin)
MDAPRLTRFPLLQIVIFSGRILMLTVYTLSNCDTCRAATKWLKAHGLPFEERAIRETPPSTTELRTALGANAGELRKLFSTSGRDYREQKLGEKLPGMSESAALKLLAANGNLVKRPFLVGNDIALVGFDPAVWAAALAKGS